MALEKENSDFKEQELQDLTKTTTGDFIDNFVTRTFGKAKGQAKLGSYSDLAIFTRHEDIRVVVICMDLILRNSPKPEDHKSVYEDAFHGECEKRRVVCAILSSGHFDIGVVNENGSTRAVFELGSYWDWRSVSTSVPGEARANPEPAEGCACGETSCECRSKTQVALSKVTCVIKKLKIKKKAAARWCHSKA